VKTHRMGPARRAVAWRSFGLAAAVLLGALLLAACGSDEKTETPPDLGAGTRANPYILEQYDERLVQFKAIVSGVNEPPTWTPAFPPYFQVYFKFIPSVTADHRFIADKVIDSDVTWELYTGNGFTAPESTGLFCDNFAPGFVEPGGAAENCSTFGFLTLTAGTAVYLEVLEWEGSGGAINVVGFPE